MGAFWQPDSSGRTNQGKMELAFEKAEILLTPFQVIVLLTLKAGVQSETRPVIQGIKTRHHGPSAEIHMVLLLHGDSFELYQYYFQPAHEIGWGLYGKKILETEFGLIEYLMKN